MLKWMATFLAIRLTLMSLTYVVSSNKSYRGPFSRFSVSTITSHQHGFLPRRSCISNLLILEETATLLMDDGNNADFAEAFDSVNHM